MIQICLGKNKCVNVLYGSSLCCHYHVVCLSRSMWRSLMWVCVHSCPSVCSLLCLESEALWSQLSEVTEWDTALINVFNFLGVCCVWLSESSHRHLDLDQVDCILYFVFSRISTVKFAQVLFTTQWQVLCLSRLSLPYLCWWVIARKT